MKPEQLFQHNKNVSLEQFICEAGTIVPPPEKNCSTFIKKVFVRSVACVSNFVPLHACLCTGPLHASIGIGPLHTRGSLLWTLCDTLTATQASDSYYFRLKLALIDEAGRQTAVNNHGYARYSLKKLRNLTAQHASGLVLDLTVQF